jgi:Protein of unknown function (DUF2752)
MMTGTNNVFIRIQEISLVKRIMFGFLIFIFLNQLSQKLSSFDNGPILCPFRLVTSLPCPFCGTTRSVGRILTGDFLEALYLNPLGYVLLLGLLFTLISPRTLDAFSHSLSLWWWRLNTKSQYLIGASAFISIWLLNSPRLI